MKRIVDVSYVHAAAQDCLSGATSQPMYRVGDVVIVDRVGEAIHFAKLAVMPIGTKVSALLSIAMSLLWSFFFTARTVRSAAFAYADMLMRACDVLPKKR